MFKHTAGPWTVNGNAIESEDMILAHIYDPDDNGPDEWQANAQLIAAAPELLAACVDLLECFEHGDRWTSVSRRIAANTLRTAIAKASPTAQEAKG